MKLTEIADDLAAKVAAANDAEARLHVIKHWLLDHKESVLAMYEEQNVPLVVNHKAPGDLAEGDYVFASRWSDCDPGDPWAVGYISEVGTNYVVIGEVGRRRWPYAMRISEELGRRIAEQYPPLEEGRSLNYPAIARVFGIADA